MQSCWWNMTRSSHRVDSTKSHWAHESEALKIWCACCIMRSVCLSVNSVCLSVCPFICLSVHLSLFIHLLFAVCCCDLSCGQNEAGDDDDIKSFWLTRGHHYYTSHPLMIPPSSIGLRHWLMTSPVLSRPLWVVSLCSAPPTLLFIDQSTTTTLQ